jgi:hypothetical protein
MIDICIDQIPTEFGEQPCANERRRIWTPHPHVEANATDALHDAQRQEQRSSAPARSESHKLKVGTLRRRRQAAPLAALILLEFLIQLLRFSEARAY